MAGTLGEANPFRYRGYVYDEETGLYYLQSRYYNPVWQRFVNGDSKIDASSLLKYCCNDPVCRNDENGQASRFYEWITEFTRMHNAVVTAVKNRVFGQVERHETFIPGAGRNGGPEYPDVVVKSNKLVWEIKPLSPYGIRTGKEQIRNYTRSGEYKPGYAVEIEPIPYVFFGVKGMIEVINGSELTCDAGVVYYRFIPYKEQIPEMEPVGDEQEHAETSVVNNTLAIVGAVGVAVLTLINPIPGDEMIAIASLSSIVW